MSKTTKEKIEIMQAYEDGKNIKCFNKYGVEVCTYDKSTVEKPSWDWLDYNYIVEEEPKYRPYVDTEEMINDFCERSGAKRSKMGEPFIWVKDKSDSNSTKYLIIRFAPCSVRLGSYNDFHRLSELFDNFTYCDGTPIGKKE